MDLMEDSTSSPQLEGGCVKSCTNIAERLCKVTNKLGGIEDRAALAVANRVVLYNVPWPAPANCTITPAIVLIFCFRATALVNRHSRFLLPDSDAQNFLPQNIFPDGFKDSLVSIKLGIEDRFPQSS
jgi:hypothetical protein